MRKRLSCLPTLKSYICRGHCRTRRFLSLDNAEELKKLLRHWGEGRPQRTRPTSRGRGGGRLQIDPLSPSSVGRQRSGRRVISTHGLLPRILTTDGTNRSWFAVSEVGGTTSSGSPPRHGGKVCGRPPPSGGEWAFVAFYCLTSGFTASNSVAGWRLLDVQIARGSFCSEEESQDLSSQVLPPGLLLVHDTARRGQHDVPADKHDTSMSTKLKYETVESMIRVNECHVYLRHININRYDLMLPIPYLISSRNDINIWHSCMAWMGQESVAKEVRILKT